MHTATSAGGRRQAVGAGSGSGSGSGSRGSHIAASAAAAAGGGGGGGGGTTMYGANDSAAAARDAGSSLEPRDSPWADRSCRFDGAAGGPLSGLTFGAKDIFEVRDSGAMQMPVGCCRSRLHNMRI